jgi:hypothetical protein
MRANAAAAAVTVAAALTLSACAGQSPAPVMASPPVTAAAAATGHAAPDHRAHRDRATVAHQAGHHHTAAGGLLAVHDPGQVTGTLTGPCHTRDHGLLPDRSCTPGAIDPAITQATIGSTICRPGYTDSVRPPESQTEAFKWNVAEPAYGQHDVPASSITSCRWNWAGPTMPPTCGCKPGRSPTPRTPWRTR